MEKDKVKKTVKSKEKKTETTDSKKTVQYLAYVGILFLIGLFSSDKEDKDVKFHVGQGILVSIVILIVYVINSLVIYNVFSVTVWGIKTVTGTGHTIGSLLYLIPAVLAVIGMLNVRDGNKKELPLIGKLAFYK